ncbi:MAG: chemotaxis response regulator protein-glutamate methylesterase [Nitrospirae bacterium]|nr:chemotaxis response regulator protein-glutamate methylesterase [Nitrospirota bacterium]
MKPGKIRVLIIDDSPFVRQSIARMISETSHIEVAGTVPGGVEAMKFLEKEKPDLITLDLEMPGMNGFTFLNWLMKNCPLPVLVISSQNESQNVFKALELGALEFISKPNQRATLEFLNLKEELVKKIEIISKIPKSKIQRQATIYSGAPYDIKADVKQDLSRRGLTKGTRPRDRRVTIVVIGASTGGPAALQLIVSSLPDDLQIPIVIVQHMPPNFTNSFAKRLDSLSKLRVKEAEEGDRLTGGQIYVAPGGVHLIAKRSGDGMMFYLSAKEEKDRYTPSIDKTMVSIADLYGDGTLGMILTGMGNDGTEGVKRIKEKGGMTLAESEETAVVYGMPRVPAQLGMIDQIVPITEMASQMIRLCKA